MSAVPLPTRNSLFLTLEELTESYSPFLKRTFFTGAAFIMGLLVYQTERPAFELVTVCYLVGLLSLLPGWLWVTRRVGGLPIVPVIAAADVIAMVLPVVSDHPALRQVRESELMLAVVAQGLFITLLTTVWYRVARRPVKEPLQLLMLPQERIHSAFYYVAALWIGIAVLLYQIAYNQYWIDLYLLQYIGYTLRNPLNTIVSMAMLVSTFVLCLGIGQRAVTTSVAVLSVAVVLLTMLVMASNLILATLIVQLMAGVIGYILGRGRIPWIPLILLALLLNLLNLGKWDMRRKYWEIFDGTPKALGVTDYVPYYVEWIGHGVDHMLRPRAMERDDRAGLLGRASLIQMLVYAQARVPDDYPYLMGESYSVIPGLLVPRVLNPTRARSHEGQVILSVKLGLQSLEGTQNTYIAWGMLAEGWANFGWFGIIGCGILSGYCFGIVARITRRVPFASLRFVFCTVLFLFSTVLTTTTASIWVISTYQGLLVITIMCLIVMARQKNPVLTEEEHMRTEVEIPTLDPTPEAIERRPAFQGP